MTIKQYPKKLISIVRSSIKSFSKLFEPYKTRKTISNCYSINKPIKIIIGSASTRQDGWLSTNQNTLDLLKRNTWEKLFKPNSVDALLAEHVWEHLSFDEGVIASKNCFDFLKPGGSLRIAIPDGLHPDKNYIEYVKPGGLGAGAKDHKMLYTYKTVTQMLQKGGFSRVNLLEYFHENGQFHKSTWNNDNGYISRSSENDDRNRNGKLAYTSIIVDAIK
jgi:predicted SAM-dependent methyltransferase